MEIISRRRRKPTSSKETEVLLIVLGVVALAVGGFFSLWGITPNPCHGLLFVLPGTYIVIRRLRARLWHRSDGNVFHRSSATAPARVIRHWTQEGVDDYGDRFTTYYVRVQFDTVEKQEVALQAEVKSKLYDRLPPGTTVTVHYATEDPCIALLEGEHFSFLGDFTFATFIEFCCALFVLILLILLLFLFFRAIV